MDTVGDTLARIKNGYLAFNTEVVVPYSKLVLAVCKVLVKEGYIEGCQELKEEGKNYITKISVTLKYHDRKPVLTNFKRVSKPGLRVYKGRGMLPFVLNGLGVAIVSTPKGIMTDKEARKEGVGGEIMAYVW